tara:strand:+ start:104 stop:1036 length:933 start_codon:yes stop_codon:yes gene_type:complete
MKHTFTREQIKRIILEELKNSTDEEEAEEHLRNLIGLNEQEDTDEFEKKIKRAKTLKNWAGISLLGAVVALFGGFEALNDMQAQQVQQDAQKVQQLDAETLEKFGVDVEALVDPEGAAAQRGASFATAELGLVDLSDMKNSQKVEVLWDQIDNMVDRGQMSYKKAKVGSPLPGGYATLDYDAIPPDLVLPNSLKTKDEYRAWLIQNVLRGDKKNIGDLKKFVFGSTGKWPSGTGEKKSRYAGKAQVLPGEWTVAFDLYGDIVEEMANSFYENIKNEDTRDAAIAGVGAKDLDQAIEIVNGILYTADRQIR